MSRSVPSPKKIHEYWLVHAEACGFGHQMEEEPACFACGCPAFERAHIVAASNGGTNTCDNLVLLCGRCHWEAPDLNDHAAMYDFIAKRPAQTQVFMDNVLDPITDSDEMRSFEQSSNPNKEEAFTKHFKSIMSTEARSHSRCYSFATYIGAAKKALKKSVARESF